LKFYFQKIFLIILFGFSACERPTENPPEDDGIPPAVPAGLRVYYASDGDVIIEWRSNVERNLKIYKIYRSEDDSLYMLIDSTTSTFYFDDSLDYDITYFYKISAQDFLGRESELSPSVSASPINRFEPARINFLRINGRNWEGEISFYLSWERNRESDVIGYNIYKSDLENFTADSSMLIGFSEINFFNDTSHSDLYQNYFFKVRAVDKGGLISSESISVSDIIMDIPSIVFPQDNEIVNFFNEFKIESLNVPAEYEIVVQRNKFFGQFWSRRISSEIINDTIAIRFNPPFLEQNVKYYWRIITYSKSGSEPNSISHQYSFTIEP
jgi:hypothetical protein